MSLMMEPFYPSLTDCPESKPCLLQKGATPSLSRVRLLLTLFCLFLFYKTRVPCQIACPTACCWT